MPGRSYSLFSEKKGIIPWTNDAFLWAHWAMYFPYNRDEANALEKFLLGREFTANRVFERQIEAVQLQNYVASVHHSVQRWYEIHFPQRASGLSDGVRSELERLDRLDRAAFEPLIMAALQVRAEVHELQKLLQAAERFIFVVNRLCRVRSDTGDFEFYRVANEVFSKNTTVTQATLQINNRTVRHFSRDKAVTEMRELFRFDSGFYSWSGLRYFLFEYEQYLKTLTKREESKINWDEFTTSKRDYVTVERIYPQTPKQDDWPEFEARSEEERTWLMNSLGNLLALSQARNSALSNRKFEQKKQDENGVRGYDHGSYSEIAVAQFTDWSPETVLKRGLDMLDFMEVRWNMSLGTEEEKKRLLFLDFLK